MKTLFVLSLLALPALAADYSLQLKPESTKIQFTLTDPLHTVHGAFSLKQGEIGFNTETGKCTGKVVVDVTSGDSGSGARDSRMHGNVLESKKYPEAVFTPDHFEGAFPAQGASALKVHGTFTIHGAAHEMTMDVQKSVNEDRSFPGADYIRASMAFDIPYVAWGMKDPSNFLLKVGKSVHMTIETAGPLQKH